MAFISNLFYAALYQPLFNFLILLYEYLPGHDFGVAVIVLTLLIRFILYPFGTQTIKSQKALSEIQPKIAEIQEMYKNDKEKQTAAIMEVYKKSKINPFSGCLPLIIQLPILFALYRVFWQGLRPAELARALYSWVPQINALNTYFLGVIDLSKPASIKLDDGSTHFLWLNIILILLVGITQFWQMKMISFSKRKKAAVGDNLNQISQIMQKQSLYFFPAFTVFVLWNLPAALALYWLVTTIFSIVQQYKTLKIPPPVKIQ